MTKRATEITFYRMLIQQFQINTAFTKLLKNHLVILHGFFLHSNQVFYYKNQINKQILS